jgi:hypothetical protein
VSSKKDRTEHKDTELGTYKSQHKFQKNNTINTFHKVVRSFFANALTENDGSNTPVCGWSEMFLASTIDGNIIGKISIHVKLQVILSSSLFYTAV